MTLQSPKGETLQLIDGDPGDLRRSAVNLINSGDKMKLSADRLEDISSGTSDLKSEAIAKVRESAGEVFPELRKAGIRYAGTGEALKKYAEALDEVQGSMQAGTSNSGVDNYASLNALIMDIEEAHQTAETKRSQERSAQGDVSEHNGFLGIGEGTDEQKAEAKSDLSDATAAREDAEEELNALWGKFDGRVSYWEDAYNDAIDEIEDAFEAADNDDKFLSTLNNILSIAALVLGVLALVLATTFLGPILAAVALIASVIVLLIEIGKFVLSDDGDWGSLGLAILGILPFGRFAGKAVSGFSKVFKGGFKSGIKSGPKNAFKAFSKTRNSNSRSMVRNSIRGKTKRPVKTTIRGNRQTKKSIRRNNRKLERDYQQTTYRNAKDYLAKSDKAFNDDKWKYAKYLADGGSAKQRALADYIRKNPQGTGPEAVKWAEYQKYLGFGEDVGSYGANSGATVYEMNREKIPQR